MATVALIVENIVKRRPFLEEALAQGIINYAALAQELLPDVEQELQKKVQPAAILMALRRFQEKLEKSFIPKARIKFKESDVMLRSDLFEITIVNSPTAIKKMKTLYDLVDVTRGDFLTVTHGIYEITIISNRKHKQKIISLLEEEETKKMIEKLSSVTMKIPLEAIHTVGLFYILMKALNWENINIVEIVSTLTEMTFILEEKDAPKAFTTLKKIIEEKS